MATINPHTTRATGTVLTASIYNTDHQNHITNANNLNAQLSAIAGLGTATGILVSNGAGVFSGRSLQPVVNQTVITNANGVAGDPSVGIANNPVLPGNVSVGGGLAVTGGLSVTGGITETKDGMILVPTNQDYMVCLKMPHGGTITETVTKDTSGTCTATFKINAAALDGAANAVSASEVSVAHAASNVFAAGDDLVITISANAACLNMSYQIKYTRIGTL